MCTAFEARMLSEGSFLPHLEDDSVFGILDHIRTEYFERRECYGKAPPLSGNFVPRAAI